ncbi:MAG: hypothetical protein AMXMBFR47_32780 [Planctomycetota bacterium]
MSWVYFLLAGAAVLLLLALSIPRAEKPAVVEPPSPRGPRRPLPGSRWRTQHPGDSARLRSLGLPELRDTRDLLRWLRLSLRELVPLADHANRATRDRNNYIEWTVPKRRGGKRVIAAPKKRLKAIQTRILREILDRVPPSAAAHGFVRGRNIVSNAAPHVGRAIVVNFDLVDFFEHVHFPRVMGVFRRLGYSKEVARWLAYLCTHRPLLVAGDQHGPIAAARHAVQGAPTSPAVSNLAVHRLDARLAGLARRFGCTYTRYADDLTFSGDEPFKRSLKRFVPLVRRIVSSERFRLHEGKMRFVRAGRRQEVTGVVVNRKINGRREEYDRLKAIIHNARRSGSLESQNREGRPHFRAYLLGRASHIAMLSPERGQRLMREIRRLT